jgi:hypothetical protein
MKRWRFCRSIEIRCCLLSFTNQLQDSMDSLLFWSNQFICPTAKLSSLCFLTAN